MNQLYRQLNQDDFFKRFNQFSQNFNGNARMQIQQMLNSGRVTQERYNQAVQQAQQAQQLGKLIGIFK